MEKLCRHYTVRIILVCIGIAGLVLVSGCGPTGTGTEQQAQGIEPKTAINAASSSALLSTLPKQGKLKLPNAPTYAVFGEIYINTTTNKEWIFDGNQWVPHDNTVDAYYQSLSTIHTRLTATEVCVDGDPSCTPTGAHGGPGTSPAGHYAFACTTCHKVGGRLSFDKNGKAYGTGSTPTFDATAKTCSNIACHSVQSGTFSYYFSEDGNGNPVLYTVNVYGNTGGTTPYWYTTAISCTACHPDPPRNGTDGSNAWHSGNHGNQGPTGALNQCQLCHPDASSPGNGIGDTITNPTLHANGVYDVVGKFTSSCFYCH